MRKPLPTRNQVLELFAEDDTLHAREIAKRLEVPEVSFDGLLRVLDDLTFDGILVAKGQRFKFGGKRGSLAKSDEREERKAHGRDSREGILKVNPRGFGFVTSPTATGDDVFINADSLGGGMNGDTVVVEIMARGSRGAEGRIVEVKKRATPRVSGILRRKGKSAYVEPDDPRVRGPIVLTREIDLAGPEGNSGSDGQVVVVQITRFPERPDENAEGKLVAVLGTPGELSVEVRKVLMLGSIEEVHSPAAVEEAEGYGLEVPAEMLAGHEDLTHIPLPTIDPEDARDHDDAVWVERTPSGGYEVWVAIADVSAYVRPGMNLDEEAKTRGCSIYLPDRAIPMLPRALSSNLCSLLPDVVRLCLCVHAELDAKGSIKKSRLVRGFMKSAAKLHYGGVARALGFTALPERQEKAEAMVDGLRVAYELSRILRGKRMKRGALDFDLPEAVVKLSPEGNPVTLTKRAQDPGVKKAYQLIEELMIFANEVVARWLVEHGLPGVFRVHLPPDPQKLEKLAAMCEVLGIELDVEATQTPTGLSDLLSSFAEHPLAHVLNNLLLRSMKQATYDVQNLGHFGLASEAYLHFTSPIRRYPDLVVHRIVHAYLSEQRDAELRVAADKEKLTEAAMQSSLAERRAMEVEREIMDVYRCFYMIDRIGEQFEATVTAFVGSGAFATIADPFVDVMIKVEDMGFGFNVEDDGLMATSPSGESIRLGDVLMVQITDCAILRRTVYAKRLGGSADDGEGFRGGRRKGPRAPVPPKKTKKSFGGGAGRNDRQSRGARDDRASGGRKGKPEKKKSGGGGGRSGGGGGGGARPGGPPKKGKSFGKKKGRR